MTADNVRNLGDDARREVRQLLDGDGTLAEGLDLEAGWAVDVIAAVGNYGELFERNLGRATRLGLDRGLNALSRDGGLH